MAKANVEYYNLEKVAEVLSVSTAEVNRLREQSKLRGFRDGSTWKFVKDEVHAYLADTIRARSSSASSGIGSGDSDFDLGGDSASASSFDILMEDAALPDDSDLVSVAPVHPASDLDLAALDQDDELALAEETHHGSLQVVPKKEDTHVSSLVVPKKEDTHVSSLVVPKKAKPKEESDMPEIFAVQDDDDSSALLLAAPEVLTDEASVLEAGKSSPQLGLAGDSGFDVLVAGEEEDALLVAEEDTESVPSAMQDFELAPSPKTLHDDDSESSSQVIAIDAFAGAGQDADPFGQQDGGFGDFAGFDSGLHQAPAAAASADPFGSPDAFAMPIASVSSPKAAKATTAPAEEYSTGMLATLVIALVVLLLPGMMVLDTMVHMWSWGSPFILNSVLMDTISGLFEL